MSTLAMTPFQHRLKKLMNEYVHYVYDLTKQFPIDERFGSVSQCRRASLSVILNYIEGFTRRRPKVILDFYERSYGSLNESRYLLEFALERGWISQEQYDHAINLADEIGAMLWSEISSTEKKID